MADAPAFQVVPGRAPQPAAPDPDDSTAAATLHLLVVVPMVPYPPVWGYAQRCFQLARQLARRHRVTMVCYALADQADDVADLAEHLHEVVTVPQTPTAGWRRRLDQLRSVWSSDPYHSSGSRTSAMQATVDELVRSRRVDAVIIESSQMGWLSVPADVPVYVDEHNIESELLERMARSERSVLRRLFYQVEHRRYRRFEDAVWERSAGCAATSQRDASMITSRRPEIPVAVVPNGVDTEQFSPEGGDPVPSRLVFTGLLDYRPNYDGIHWFLDEVYPLIQRSHPSVELQVVGHGSPAVLRSLRRPGVEVTGRVPDLRVHLDEAAVAVVPLRIGGGTRLKVVEAMSMGKAIVSTTLGAEGIDVVHDRHVLLADTAADFADAVVALLDDSGRRTHLGTSARRLATDQYSWERSAEQFNVLLEHQVDDVDVLPGPQTHDVEHPMHVRNAVR